MAITSLAGALTFFFLSDLAWRSDLSRLSRPASAAEQGCTVREVTRLTSCKITTSVASRLLSVFLFFCSLSLSLSLFQTLEAAQKRGANNNELAPSPRAWLESFELASGE
ncbi:hypothetical protein BCV70DRAFT_45381 [Testicularia cyperi]|uniref:Uncharacterized protein n=1 Tax=Testicularia cyperi TaxID=1882483 RepID=A0A317XJ12_9BASI|nr:hypothetical protein BCV70DRAFT_45381 [Testicularia cyperi]